MINPILDALEHIHRMGIYHKNIKPQSIFLKNNNEPILISFGVSASKEIIITTGYSPIEQYQSNLKEIGRYTDIYAIGATLYKIIMNEILMSSIERQAEFFTNGIDLLKPLVLNEILLDRYSKNFLEAIDWALQLKKEDRPQTIQDFKMMLNSSTKVKNIEKISALFEDSSVLPLGYILNNKYKIINALGKGGFGIVYKVEDIETKEIFAIKELFVNTVCFRRRDSQQIDSNNRELFASLKEKTYKEVNLLSSINYENIVKEYGYFEENDTCYIVMEYVDGKNLNQFLKFDSAKFNEVEAKELLKQLISGLKEVYKKKIIHRDINPSNILKTRDGIYKLIDFNSLKYMSNEEVSITGTGTNSFIAPELATRKAKVGIFSDIYSIGMTLFALLQNEYTPEILSPLILHTTSLTQHFPNYADRLFEEKDMVYHKIERLTIDDKFKQILKKMLELRSEDRYQSLEEIEDELFNEQLNKENYNDSSKKLILFISTVNSNHETWRDFSKIINKDALFNSFDIGYFDYSSSLVANKNLLQKFLPMIFPTQSLPSIKDMADILRTEIKYHYKEYDEIYLVTHSVGGLIAKQYLYDMYEDNLPIKIRKVMFYSVPNSHSDLIRFSSVYKDEKLKQSIHVLSNFEEWSQEIYLNHFIKTHYVISKFDAIVNERSISPSFDSTNYSFVPRNHTDIVKLEDSNDISYIIFRDFILEE